MRILLGDGGGQHGTYLWGVITELVRLGMTVDYFDVELSTSASCFNSAYKLGGQLEEGFRIWTEHLPNGFWKWNSNDMGYLERVLREIEPLNYKVFPEKKTQVYVSFSNPRTLESEIKCLNHSRDPIGMLLASAAMPILTKAFELDGVRLYDGGLTSQPPLNHLSKFSATEIWVFMTSPVGYRLSPSLWRMTSMLLTSNRSVAKLLANCPERRNKTLAEIESRTDLKVIRPLAPLPIGWRSCDKTAILHTFNLGVQSAQQFARENNW